MTSRSQLRVSVLWLLITFLLTTRSSAQSPVDPGQLPSHTTFYLLWHGTPAGDVRAKNSLYALWDDPDFAPARSAFVASLLKPDAKQKDKPALTREEAARYLTLLDNPFLIGYIRRPESAAPAKSAAPSPKDTTPSAKPAWNGVFFIYDRTGKEELLSKAILRARSSDDTIPKLTNLTIAGIPALKVEGKSSTKYWAEFNKYAVSAQELPVFEEILNLLNGKPSSTSLSQSPAFLEAKPLLAGGLIEFFLNASNLKEFATDTTANSPASAQATAALSALKLDALHSLAGHLSLQGSRTRIQAAILGDTTAGSFFDIFPEGQARPASMAFVFPDTLYYSESQIDLLGFYRFIKNTFMQGGGSSQVSPLESLAATRLGMPLEDALGITTGEFASLQTSPAFDETQQVYFLGIRNKPDTLKLARTIMGDRITSERNEGTTTFLKISLQGGQSATGVAQWNFYHLALTPDALLGSPKTETLHKYLERTSTASDPPALPALQAMRAQFPEKLSGLTFADFQKMDWAALKAKWIADAKKAAQSANATDAAKANAISPEWLNQLNPEVLPRHLHTLAGASWKDAKGVHLDEWLE